MHACIVHAALDEQIHYRPSDAIFLEINVVKLMRDI